MDWCELALLIEDYGAWSEASHFGFRSTRWRYLHGHGRVSVHLRISRLVSENRVPTNWGGIWVYTRSSLFRRASKRKIMSQQENKMRKQMKKGTSSPSKGETAESAAYQNGSPSNCSWNGPNNIARRTTRCSTTHVYLKSLHSEDKIQGIGRSTEVQGVKNAIVKQQRWPERTCGNHRCSAGQAGRQLKRKCKGTETSSSLMVGYKKSAISTSASLEKTGGIESPADITSPANGKHNVDGQLTKDCHYKRRDVRKERAATIATEKEQHRNGFNGDADSNVMG